MKSYAIKGEKGANAPVVVSGFKTRAEAEAELANSKQDPGARYSIVYVEEYSNSSIDKEGNFTRPTWREIPEP